MKESSVKTVPNPEPPSTEFEQLMKEMERKFAMLVSSEEAKKRLLDELIRMSRN